MQYIAELEIEKELSELEQVAQHVQRLVNAYEATGLPTVPFEVLFSAAKTGNCEALTKAVKVAIANELNPENGERFAQFMQITLPPDWPEVQRVAAFIGAGYPQQLRRASGCLELVEGRVCVRQSVVKAVRSKHTHTLTETQLKVKALIEALAGPLHELNEIRAIPPNPFSVNWLNDIARTSNGPTLKVEPDIAHLIRIGF